MNCVYNSAKITKDANQPKKEIKCGKNNLRLLLSYIDVILTGPARIKLPTRLKEPVVVEEGEDLVLKVPYTGQPKPKVTVN